ncbi:MAG TPA: helix-turn-helix domain-containing protein, partial [Thermoanaerobaculia bacterium]
MHNSTRALRKPTFSELLRRHRRAAQLTQEELAERAALSPRGLRYLEHGTRVPYPDTVRRLAAALGLPETEAAELAAAARAQGGEARLAPVPPPPHGDIIGRQRELTDGLGLLRSRSRLLTVLGPGGVGKTRFAMELAELIAPEFNDRVAWVPLAGVGSPAEVAPTILQALGAAEASSRSEADAVVARLQESRLLLALDNFEHVASAAELVARVVTACPGVKVLVTSRVPLRLREEQEFWLDPLPLPSSEDSATPAAVRSSAAVQLFSERATAVDRHFAVNPSNAAAVAELCRRLEGLPLALELAAARVRVLPPSELVAQLANRLDLLTGGPLDAP